MKRKEILRDIPIDYDKTMEEQEEVILEYFSDVLDNIESRVGDIRDLLNIQDIGELYKVEEAYDALYKLREDLY